ncbi:hypothetical protein RAA17_06240 [Komagataeibacter rhaeticus]|nr:hypothetical protein [Komagataeibacter rhaeticus]
MGNRAGGAREGTPSALIWTCSAPACASRPSIWNSLETSTGKTREMDVDHVFLGTGVQVDVTRIPFVDPALAHAIQTEGSMPVLSRHFRIQRAGTVFHRAAGGRQFRPLLRFAYGARFAARRLSARLRRQAAAVRQPGPSPPSPSEQSAGPGVTARPELESPFP